MPLPLDDVRTTEGIDADPWGRRTRPSTRTAQGAPAHQVDTGRTDDEPFEEEPVDTATASAPQQDPAPINDETTRGPAADSPEAGVGPAGRRAEPRYVPPKLPSRGRPARTGGDSAAQTNVQPRNPPKPAPPRKEQTQAPQEPTERPALQSKYWWRRWFNLGLAPSEWLAIEEEAGAEHARRERKRLYDAIAAARLPDLSVIYVTNEKGGVGKTTTAALLAICLAETRRDLRVVLVDANANLGTTRIVMGTASMSLLEFHRKLGDFDTYGASKRILPFHMSGVPVLSSDQDTKAKAQLGETEFMESIDTLKKFFDVIILDGSNDVTGALATGAISIANQAIVPTDTSPPSWWSARHTIDLIHGGGPRNAMLADRAIAVINNVTDGDPVREVATKFEGRTGPVLTVRHSPYVKHFGETEAPDTADSAEGSRRGIQLAKLEAWAQDDILHLTAATVHGLASWEEPAATGSSED